MAAVVTPDAQLSVSNQVTTVEVVAAGRVEVNDADSKLNISGRDGGAQGMDQKHAGPGRRVCRERAAHVRHGRCRTESKIFDLFGLKPVF
jgi:hypothetical protein